MIAETTLIGIDVSRDWLDGFYLPGQKRFRHPNTADGHIALVAMVQQLSGPLKVGFEATGGHEWVLWTELAAAGIVAVQLPPAQIKAFALSRGTRAKTDRIDAELIARFMAFRPEVGRELPDENLRILRTLTTRRGQIVDMRKRLKAQIGARKKQGGLCRRRDHGRRPGRRAPHPDRSSRTADRKRHRAGGAFCRKGEPTAVNPGNWSRLCGDVDRRIA